MFELYSLEEHFRAIDRTRLREILAAITKNKSFSRPQFDRLDDNLHNLLISASGNDFLIDSYIQINDLIVLFRRLDKDRIQSATKEHQELIKAILNDDLQSAKRILKEHIDLVTRSVLNNLQ